MIRLKVIAGLLILCPLAYAGQSDEAVQASNSFGFELLQKLGTDNQQNIFISPYSISTLFALVAEGAAGDTRTEIDRVFHLPIAHGESAASFEALQNAVSKVQKGTDVALNSVNGIWIQNDYEIKPSYLTIAQDQFFARIAPADFIHQPDTERQTINQWVASATQGRIQDLFPAGMINELTRMVLANALYFKGQWDTAFDKTLTQDLDFHLEAGSSDSVPFMRADHAAGYTETPDAQWLLLPYKHQTLSMIVILPKPQSSLSKVLAETDDNLINQVLGRMSEHDMPVYLPRFKLEYERELTSPLKQLGIQKAFVPSEADFTGITKGKELSIFGFVHKTFIEVNEEGTEAAAASGMVMTTKAVMQKPAIFRADHPFLFLIRDVATGAILFLGRVTNPG